MWNVEHLITHVFFQQQQRQVKWILDSGPFLDLISAVSGIVEKPLNLAITNFPAIFDGRSPPQVNDATFSETEIKRN